MLKYENEKDVLESYSNFKISKNVISDYRSDIKGVENLTSNQIKRKLFRNLLLSHEYDNADYEGRAFSYGNLFMLVKNNKLVYLENFGARPAEWNKDKVKYKELNKTLGINY